MTSSSRHRNVPPPSGATTRTSSPYARFIPREELSSFAAWEPGDLSGVAAAGAATAPAAAAEEVDPAEQVRSARQSGYQDGYRDGLVALEGFKQSFAQQATSQVGALLASIGGQLDGLQQEMARAVAQTALRLARQVVRSELATRPEAVATVAQEALETLLLSARHITLRVHPDDHALVVEGAGEVLAARGARVVADPEIARGGCLVESNIGVIDATIETRWRRAAAAIGADDVWHADAPDPAEPTDPTT